jgi:aldose 1-epimerase
MDHEANEEILLQRSGLQVHVLPMGASVASVRLPSGTEVAMALQDASSYGADGSCAGSILGPAAGRIAGGRLQIGGRTCQLDQNEGQNTLHGGRHGLTHQRFEVLSRAEDHVLLQASLPDGLDGWPGNRTIRVEYRLEEKALTILLEGESDADTWLDLSSHLYWNMSGNFTKSALDQQLQIRAERVILNDSHHLPQSLEQTASTAFDFREPHTLRERMEAYPQEWQLKNALGYNNAFILESRDFRREPAAVLRDPASGNTLALFTDQPALVLYSGGYLDSSTMLAGGIGASSSCAIALEAQGWPDAGHLEGAPSALLKRGEHYRKFIRFQFS